MRWLVDGMNVIGSRPDGWWRDRTGAMRALARDLDVWAAAHRADVTLVLDGAPRDLGATPSVAVAFAPGGRDAADDEIARRVADDARPTSVVVVTSDTRLAQRVRSAGAQVRGAGDFRRDLDGLGGGGAPTIEEQPGGGTEEDATLDDA